MIVLTWHLAEVDHFKVCTQTWSLTLSSIHASPLMLDLYEDGNLAENTNVDMIKHDLKKLAAFKNKNYNTGIVMFCCIYLTFSLAGPASENHPQCLMQV